MVTEIRREFNTGFGPVDLLVQGTEGGISSVLAIENKIESPESNTPHR